MGWGPHRLGNTCAVGHAHLLAVDGVEPPGRAQRVGELAADVGDLRDWQEGRHSQQHEKRQRRGIERALGDQRGPGNDNAEAAEPGRHLQERGLGSEVGEEGETGAMVSGDALDKDCAPHGCMLKDNDLG